ncbi:hypothetical protein ACP4OV_029419 [Aristida adscensionis]
MALSMNKSTGLLFLVALLVMVVVVSSSPAGAAGEQCNYLRGCLNYACRDLCISEGFVNPVVKCLHQGEDDDTCCCSNPAEE